MSILLWVVVGAGALLVLLLGGFWWGTRPSLWDRSADPAPAPEQPRPAPASTTTVPLYDRLVRLARTDGVFGTVSERLYVRILGPRPEAELGPDERVTHAMRHGDAELVPVFAGLLRQDGGRERLENHMTHFLMGALGGPKRYTGRGMAAAHASLGITGDQFDRVLGHVGAALGDLGVPASWIAEIGRTVAPLRDAVVTAPARA